MTEPATLAAFELVDGVYKPVEDGMGKVELSSPARMTFDLDALTRLR